MKLNRYLTPLIISWTAIWLALLFINILGLVNSNQLSHTSAEIEFIIHAFMLFGVYRIFNQCDKRNQAIFKWVVIAVIGLFLNDLAFYLVVYFPNNYIINISSINLILVLLPYSLWVSTILVFFCKILINNLFELRKFLKILSIFIIFNAIVIYLCLSSLDYALGIFSWKSILQILSYIGESIIFDLAILGLVYSENRGLSFFLSGLVVLISGDFLIDYSFLSQTSTFESYGELLWFMGLLLILFGLWVIEYQQTFSIANWLRKTNTIKSKLAIWVFIISMVNILPIFILAYFFSTLDKTIFLILPLFLMIYSVGIVILSLFVGKNFELPFKKIATNIESLMLYKDKKMIQHEFVLEEFIFLQKFIIDAYSLKKERDRAKKKLNDLTAQAAHDIRSPASALLVLAKKCTEIDEEDRIALREAANTIQDIANNLLNQYQIGTITSKEDVSPKDLLISAIVLQVLSEKKLQYKEKDIKFTYQFNKNSYFSFVRGDQTSFKRMLSNILNNAVEACNLSTGHISLVLDIDNNDVVLSIIDDGKGMPQKVINKIIKHESISSGKIDGYGIGLNQVQQVLKLYKGKMEIESIIGKGTHIKLKFPKRAAPAWICDKLTFNHDDIILVLDDDATIHTAWEHRLKEITEQSKSIEIYHFQEPDEALAYWNQLDEKNKKRVFLLSDYEFLKQQLTGLDIIEKMAVYRSTLVTSHYTNPHIVKRAAMLRTKILPKLLVAEVDIQLKLDNIQAIDTSTLIDIIIIDDKPEFMQVLITHYLKDKNVKLFSDPYEFLNSYSTYAKQIPICLDNDLGLPELTGRDIAEKLHAEGFTNLYLISGKRFYDLPAYLRAISKNEINIVFNS